jgi:hypothetical protein
MDVNSDRQNCPEECHCRNVRSECFAPELTEYSTDLPIAAIPLFAPTAASETEVVTVVLLVSDDEEATMVVDDEESELDCC